MRELRLFAILDDEKESELEVSAIHDEAGYRRVRESLAHQYDLGAREPNIQVWNVNLRGDRSLTLRHMQHNDRPLDDSAQEVLQPRRAAVGLRRSPRKRRRQGRRDEALDGASARDSRYSRCNVHTPAGGALRHTVVTCCQRRQFAPGSNGARG